MSKFCKLDLGELLLISQVCDQQGILKGRFHCTIDLLLDSLGLVCFANKTKIVSCHTADSKPVK